MNKIKVGFDISQIAHYGGVASYTNNLAHNLIKNEDLEMVFFYSSLRRTYKGDLRKVKSFMFPPTILEKMFNDLRWPPIERFIGRVDIFHSSDWTQPKSSAKKVTTYHDLIPLKFPEWSDPKVVKVHKKRLKIVEKEIDHVICVSEATKKDLLEVSNIPGDKITVVYEGVNPRFAQLNEEEVEKFRRRYKLPKSFVLAIGGVGMRRNLDRVRQATKRLNLELVITNLDIKVPDNEMALLYNSADALIYPSLYEGFGLPVLEAQACGVPVITSKVASLPEISGDGAILVDPFSLDQICQAIKDIDDSKLRGELIRKGKLNSKKFTWERCADETAKVYQRLIKAE